MSKQGRRLVRFAVAWGLIVALSSGCAPPGSPTATTQPSATPTPTFSATIEATARALPSPPPTAVPSGGGETATPGPQDVATPEATQAPTAEPTLGAAPEPTPGATALSLCPDLELKIIFYQVQSLQAGETSIENTIQASGSVPLTVDLNASPPRLSGAGELPVTGGGHAGDCTFENSGSIAYRFEGEILPGPEGQPELRLRGQRAMQVVASGNCGGGGAMPFEDMGEQVLPYRSGASVDWSWEVAEGGVQGSSKWMLHFLCEE